MKLTVDEMQTIQLTKTIQNDLKRENIMTQISYEKTIGGVITCEYTPYGQNGDLDKLVNSNIYDDVITAI